MMHKRIILLVGSLICIGIGLIPSVDLLSMCAFVFGGFCFGFTVSNLIYE